LARIDIVCICSIISQAHVCMYVLLEITSMVTRQSLRH